MEHNGIKVEFVGSIGTVWSPCTASLHGNDILDSPACRISKERERKLINCIFTLTCFLVEMFYDRGNHYEFRTMQQELAVPGELRSNTSFDFEFRNVEKQYESYHGINVKLRYATAENLSMDGHVSLCVYFDDQKESSFWFVRMMSVYGGQGTNLK